LESWPVNTAAYTEGYESASDWKIRGDKAVNLNSTFGVGFMASNVIDNSSTKGKDLCAFAYIAAVMYDLDIFGTSDTSYGSSSAVVRYWERPESTLAGSPVVFQDISNSDVYRKHIGDSRQSLTFTTSQQSSVIETQVPVYGSLYSANLNQSMAISTTPVKFTLLKTAGVCKNITGDGTNSKFTVQVPGDYEVFFDVSSLVSTAKDVQFHLRKNGTELALFGSNTRALTTRTWQGFCNIDSFVAGDVLEVYVEASGSINITVWDTHLIVKKVS
jgi:hypothetical protein